jgi:hypothetical protein
LKRAPVAAFSCFFPPSFPHPFAFGASASLLQLLLNVSHDAASFAFGARFSRVPAVRFRLQNRGKHFGKRICKRFFEEAFANAFQTSFRSPHGKDFQQRFQIAFRKRFSEVFLKTASQMLLK